MPERQIQGPPAKEGLDVPTLRRENKPPEMPEAAKVTKEMSQMEGGEEATFEIMEALFGALLELLIAKKLITKEELLEK